MSLPGSPAAPDRAAGATPAAASRVPRYSHREILRVVIGTMPVMFMGALDQTIVAIALVAISRDLGHVELVPWVVTGYLIASSISTPIYGKLSDLFGRWPMLAVSIVLFVLASTTAAFAQSMTQLLALRLLQGLGGGGLITLTQAVVGDVAPGHLRGRYQGYLASVFATAAVLGPIAGGVLTQYISWRAVFAVNIPLGIAAFLIARRALRTLPVEVRHRPIDYAGAALLGLALSCLLIALTALGGRIGGLDGWVVPLAATGIVASIALVLRERRAPEPILPPSLFRNRVVTLCIAVAGLGFFVLIGSQVQIPMALQSMHGQRADQVALALIPLTLATPCGAMVCGMLMTRMISFRWVLALGQAVSLLALLPLAIFMPGPGLTYAILLAGLGFGIGLTLPATIAAPQMAVERELIGITTATLGLARPLGGAIGIAILSTALFTTIGTAAAPASSGAGAIGDLAAIPPGILAQGFRVSFAIMAAASVLALVAALRMPQRNPTLN